MKLLSTDDIATGTNELLSTDDSNCHQLICYLLMKTAGTNELLSTDDSKWH